MFRPFGKAKSYSIVDHLEEQIATGAIGCADASALGGPFPTTAISIGLSVGQGRGATRLVLNGADTLAVADQLAAFDPARPLNAAEIVARTISADWVGEGEERRLLSISFKLSEDKHSRQISIPIEEWEEFVAFMAKLPKWTEDAVAHYQEVVSKM